ncbi:MAG: threonine/homoserine/homoserine lactone efflux protein [Candidatus Azotimanducaceae bacterium]|jgi:threonine/homoserine/homoserine lactone efflux protein
MSLEILTALSIYAFVSSITPGPNNLMLMASGANYGFRRTIPHMLGVGIGFMVMLMLIGLGLKQLFDTFPLSHQILKVVSITYLVYLAYKIAVSSAPSQEKKPGDNGSNPLTFFQAALFQWVNPKAWTMALTAVTVYSPTANIDSILLIAIIFGLINLPSVSVWTLAGQGLSRFLTNEIRLRTFNISMALLLLLSMYPVLAPQQ